MCHQAYRNDRLTEKKFMLCTGVALLVVLNMFSAMATIDANRAISITKLEGRISHRLDITLLVHQTHSCQGVMFTCGNSCNLRFPQECAGTGFAAD